MKKSVLPGGRIRTEMGPNHETKAKSVQIRLGCAEIYLEREIFTNAATEVQRRIMRLALQLKFGVYVPECGPKRILIKWRDERTPVATIRDFVERLGVTTPESRSRRRPQKHPTHRSIP